MRRIICPLLLLLATLPLQAAEDKPPDGYHYDPAVGWYWYNEPVSSEDGARPAEPAAPPQETPTQKMKHLQAFRDNLMNEAMLNPPRRISGATKSCRTGW